MDIDVQRAIRILQRQGQVGDAVCSLLDEMRLGGLQRVQVHLHGLIKGWRGKQVRRAIAQSKDDLMHYTFIAASSRHDHQLKPTDVTISRDHIVFKCEFKCKHEISFNGLSLVNDIGYNFGRQRHPTGGAHHYPGNYFSEEFLLKEG